MRSAPANSCGVVADAMGRLEGIHLLLGRRADSPRRESAAPAAAGSALSPQGQAWSGKIDPIRGARREAVEKAWDPGERRNCFNRMVSSKWRVNSLRGLLAGGLPRALAGIRLAPFAPSPGHGRHQIDREPGNGVLTIEIEGHGYCWGLRPANGNLQRPFHGWRRADQRRADHQRSMRIQSHHSNATGSMARNSTSRL
jgi:hypothetical protein